jgi:hypothetical protein
MMTRDYSTLWLCHDCMYAAHGHCPEEDFPPMVEPLNRLGDYGMGNLTPGMVAVEHLDDCPAYDFDREPTGAECFGCDRAEFSRKWCDGCGSDLGGSRDAFTLWATS